MGVDLLMASFLYSSAIISDLCFKCNTQYHCLLFLTTVSLKMAAALCTRMLKGFKQSVQLNPESQCYALDSDCRNLRTRCMVTFVNRMLDKHT
jgi:hypothetical protein